MTMGVMLLGMFHKLLVAGIAKALVSDQSEQFEGKEFVLAAPMLADSMGLLQLGPSRNRNPCNNRSQE
jgi:hypothetical protein